MSTRAFAALAWLAMAALILAATRLPQLLTEPTPDKTAHTLTTRGDAP